LTERQDKVSVRIRYKDIEKEVTAPMEEAWLLVNKFFRELLPVFEIANSLWLTVDVKQLAEDCRSLIAFSEEGPNLLVPSTKLTDNETVLMWLTASYLGQKLGFLETDTLSKEELRVKLGKSGKITSTRLGELVKSNAIVKADGEKFRISTFGMSQMHKEMLPKIRAKTGG
jgi:hypothetical protein